MQIQRGQTFFGVLFVALALAGPGRAQTGSVMTADGVVLIDQQHAVGTGIGGGDSRGYPITITQSGSYRLATNLTDIPPGTNAIEIRADDVTLDLNGHSITGPGAGNSSGIEAVFNGIPIFVRSAVFNGSVSGFTYGVSLGYNSRVENIRVFGNSNTGILARIGSLVQGNIAHGNGFGIVVDSASTVRGNIAEQNTFGGISVNCPSSVVGNTASANQSAAANLFTNDEPMFGIVCTRSQNSPAP